MSDKPCKPFMGYRDSNGYGKVRYCGESRLAHRVTYAVHHGIPLGQLNGVVIRHTCDNPPCCEPDHLVAGTQADNMRDKSERGRCHTTFHTDCNGTKRYNAKLNDELVRSIRAEYIPRHREHGARAIARRLDMSVATISQCLRGEKWTHV